VPHGGTLGSTGYYFGQNAGLSLSGTGAFDVYSIDIKFFFDSLTASADGYQRILDFKNRTLDEGFMVLAVAWCTLSAAVAVWAVPGVVALDQCLLRANLLTY
jgi:hypothetical protein